jgi:transposase
MILGDVVMGRKRVSGRLKVIHPDCAGIDIGKKAHYVAVDPAVCEEPVRRFGTFTDELESLAAWLSACGVKIVAMESTGVYWIALYEILDRAGFEVHLVNPRATKQVSGRKSDVLDCQWLWQLMSYGLLKGAFRPPDGVCVVRSYVRQRARLTQDAARCVQHIQKALTEMNVQLDNVLSDIMGKTGQAILRALVAGERDGHALAQLRDRRVKADAATIARSLRGNWRAEHLFAVTQALARYDMLQNQIAACEQRIAETLNGLNDPVAAASQPTLAAPARRRGERALQRAVGHVLGVDLTAIPTIGVETALVVASEIGPDLSRFPSSEHFCSWLNVAPGTRISGDRALGGRIPKRVNRAGQALRVAAATARHSNSFIGAAHRARLRRLDKPRAIKATAHQLARLIYAMLTRGDDYVERGIEHFEQQTRDRQLRNLQRKARAMGFTLIQNDQQSAA